MEKNIFDLFSIRLKKLKCFIKKGERGGVGNEGQFHLPFFEAIESKG